MSVACIDIEYFVSLLAAQVLSLGCRGNIIGACTMKLLFEFASIEIHSNCNAGAIQALIHRIMRLHSSLVSQVSL